MKNIKSIVACCAALLLMYSSYAQPAISRIEYYLDKDPGFGKATSITFAAGTNVSNVALNIDPTSLSPGLHILGIRSKDANGGWSLDNKWLFAKPFPSDGSSPVLKRIEYYLDKDPGFGKATNIVFTQGTNLSNLTLDLDPASLANGFHILGIRSMDSLGRWSQDNKWLFAKPFPASASTPALSNIEYYLDKDPGYGKATPVSFASGTDVSNATVNIDPSALSNGLHILGIRAKDSSGFWGEDNKWLFAKPFADALATVDTLSRVEYYIDTDPGYGKGIPVATADVTNLSDINLSINISGLSTGSHHLFIRAKDRKNLWSLDNKLDFGISATVSPPSIVITSLSKKTICLPDTVKVGYQKSGTFTVGNIFNVQLSNATGSFSSSVVIGSLTGTGSSVITCPIPPGTTKGSGYRVRVVSTNPVVTGSKSVDSLNINKRPDSIKSISGPASVTSHQVGIVYSVTSVSGVTYAWTIPSGAAITAGQGTASITVTWGTASGNVTVKGSNSCGTSNTKSLAVTVGASLQLARSSSIQNNDELRMYMYPNPATTNVYLQFTTNQPGNYSVELTDIAGQVLLQKTGKTFPGVNKVIFNVSKYANGTYMLNLKDKKGLTKSVMFSKQGL